MRDHVDEGFALNAPIGDHQYREVPGITWNVQAETSVAAGTHDALAALLSQSYPDTRRLFAHGRSWAGARPEHRVFGIGDLGPVAHTGVVRRFLRASAARTDVLVADVGLVAVHPTLRGSGIGAQLMSRVRSCLVRLDVPFGFLTCDPDVGPFYERCGWSPLPDQPIRSITVHHETEPGRCNGMVLPVAASLTAWPAGPLERHGQEI